MKNVAGRRRRDIKEFALLTTLHLPRALRARAVARLSQERRGVLAGASQSEREEETRDRAERGSVVRGSDQASVAPERIPRLDPSSDADEAKRLVHSPGIDDLTDG